MFTVRFQTKNTDTYSSLNCVRYDVRICPDDVAIITVHSTYFDDSGVEFRIGRDQQYNVAYITNDVGKTIDRITVD
ncbi:MAG: hypothetical protein KDH96_12075 [Candidatus Riesia sp.]|nr:hypothetical protein [Candidatus Riesia sp.]